MLRSLHEGDSHAAGLLGHISGSDGKRHYKYAQFLAKGTVHNGMNGDQQPAAVLRRRPNRRQRAWWKAIHRAKLEGVSNRGIARNLGMSRNTVRKYLAAESPEMIGAVVTPRSPRSGTMADDTKGQNR